MEGFIDEEHSIERRYNTIMNRKNNRNYMQTVIKLQEVIRNDPDYYDPYISIAQIYKEHGKVAEANEIVEQAYQRVLARICDNDGNWPERLRWDYLENRHLIRPILFQAINLWNGDKSEEALDLFRHLLRADPEDPAGFRFFILALKKGMKYLEYDSRFAKQGFYDRSLFEWFDEESKEFPDEFGWLELEQDDEDGEDSEDEDDEDDEDLDAHFDEAPDIERLARQFRINLPSLSPENHEPMIYQLKITLKRARPATWCKVLIKDTATFAELHDIILANFHYDDDHLHDFTVRMDASNKHGISILGLTPDGDLMESMSPGFPEDKVQLRDFITAEFPKAAYTFDFGSNLVHGIVLEMVLPADPGKKYPACIGSSRKNRARGVDNDDDDDAEDKMDGD